ncbi:hypothetical protein STAIW_v1c11200 (plasmid) [Spiroplasma taiwanense CT-1]|uniref:Uncharacterized protein n=1 Tax=Spiroplasma taiwanense CT-1 TaxID=1276220 RepID=S5MDB8_9MOLU|nr:hypothetical protein STAIW_v1c11200 [Spiroplasma taiwanense CT-1]
MATSNSITIVIREQDLLEKMGCLQRNIKG